MFTVKTGVAAGIAALNNQFDIGWILGEEVDSTDTEGDLKKLMTVTYIASNQFKIESLDTTDFMQVGTKFRMKQGGSYLYMECIAISFSTDTTITTKGNSLADAVITDFYYSNNVNPYGWPTQSGGWEPLISDCVFSSADDPIFVLNITGDHAYLNPGDRFRCTQTTGGKKDFIIHAVGAFAEGVTPITIFGGTGTNAVILEDEAIIDVYFSKLFAPSGFDTDPTRWQILILDSSDYTINNVTANTWVNPGAPNMQIDVPIGTWIVGYDVHAKADRAILGTSASVYVTLSTGNNNASNPGLNSGFWLTDISQLEYKGDHIITQSFSKSVILSVDTKTRYYLNLKSLADTHLTIKGTDGTTAIYARSYFF
jgi:hypothetical protein